MPAARDLAPHDVGRPNVADRHVLLLGGARDPRLGIVAMLEAHGARVVRRLRDADTVAGWGRKRSGRRAHRLAQRYGLAPLYLEDAFMRSLGMGQAVQPLGILADPFGVHFDAHAPSLIERMLASDWTHDATRTAAALTIWRDLDLSKYNLKASVASVPDRPYHVVVDQIRGDRSISGGGVGADTFVHMLEAALEEHNGTVVVRTHPGTLHGSALARRFRGSRMHVRPVDLKRFGRAADRVRFHAGGSVRTLMARAERIHVATSLAGFESRLLGRDVAVYGAPFYAGWGNADDRMQVSDTLEARVAKERSKRRSTSEIFAAAYIHTPLYLDPATGTSSTFEQTAKGIAAMRDAF